MLRKLLFLIPVIGIALAPAIAGATQDNGIDLPRRYHLKVDICHNVSHNPHIVPVSINAVDDGHVNNQHGELIIDDEFSLVSFVPHDSGGHDKDFVVRIYVKHGNSEVNTYMSEKPCEEEEETTTTTQPGCQEDCETTTTSTTAPPTTTTTAPVTTTTSGPVTTTTVPPVVTTTAPPVVTTTTAAPAPPAPAPAASAPEAPAPAQSLPHTGSETLPLTLLGLGMIAVGTAMRRGMRHASERG